MTAFHKILAIRWHFLYNVPENYHVARKVFSVQYNFQKRLCLLNPGREENCLGIFDEKEELDLFQFRIGLECLCQNTLCYPLYKGGELEYQETVSPYAEEFYYDSCRENCPGTPGHRTYDRIIRQITVFFCENKPESYLEHMDGYGAGQFSFQKIPYQPETPQEYYIRYMCPFHTQFIKFAFPVYVNGMAVAVLFTGQFHISQGNPTSVRPKWSHVFSNEQEMEQFLKNKLLPVIRNFSQRAQENFYKKQNALFNDMMSECIANMERSMTKFLGSLSESLISAENTEEMRTKFWNIIRDNLRKYLEKIGVEELLLFISEDTRHMIFSEENMTKEIPQEISAISIYPRVERVESMCDFKTLIFIRKENGNFLNDSVLYDTSFPDETFPEIGILQLHVFSFEHDSSKRRDVLVHLEEMKPFALSVCYTPDSIVGKCAFRFRKPVLEQLRAFFEKAGQELAYFSIPISELAMKTVLRIYRHELAHQVSILERNNWFLDPERLRKTDDAKLKLVAEDQRQCLYELDFMTQNINVLTGKMSSYGVTLGKRSINIPSELFNKIKSLYSRKMKDKQLWIETGYHGKLMTLTSNLELLDIIFFNLMSNAIKYCYPGTQILIDCRDDNNYWWWKHCISFTDFGTPVGKVHQDQIFQLYFRGIGNEGMEGSGVGLYVAKIVADFLDSELSWTQRKISDYNVPILGRWHYFLKTHKDFSEVDRQAIEAEYQSLKAQKKIERICNSEYLKSNPSQWSIDEMKEELFHPTYEVTFSIYL